MAGPSKINSAQIPYRAALKVRRVVEFSFAAGCVLLASQAAAADNDQGAQIAAACASCHDPNGSDQGIPPIAGLDEQRIIAAIRAYRESEIPSHIMHAVAQSLTDEELASVASYLAARGEDGSRQ